MLVLRRKNQEEIRIGDAVVIKVLAINGRSVRIGIQAPESVAIWRAEWRSLQDLPDLPKKWRKRPPRRVSHAMVEETAN